MTGSGVDTLTGNSGGISRLNFGKQPDDIPVPADYDGDGKADIAVRRASNANWFIYNTSGIDVITDNDDGITRLRFGVQPTDIPMSADYDGDGVADIAVRRPSNFTQYIRYSSDGTVKSIELAKNSDIVPIAAPITTIMNWVRGSKELLEKPIEGVRVASPKEKTMESW